ncbi:MAG: DUF1579 domain-containing protein [Phycisphaerae bacterium]
MSFRKLLCMTIVGGLAFGVANAQDKKPEVPKKEDVKKAIEDAAKKVGDDKKTHEGGMSAEEKAMMDAMMALGQPGDNHKLLEPMVGEWTYTTKFWMDPSAPPSESTGNSSVKSLMGGRYFVGEHKGKFEMPGPDGKPVPMDFHGIATNGYDNNTKKFVSTWIDNMSTMIMTFEGTYDPATKAFTYTGTMPDCMSPGKNVSVREVIRILDKNKHVMEWYETRDGKEMKSMEITYTRKQSS